MHTETGRDQVHKKKLDHDIYETSNIPSNCIKIKMHFTVAVM